VGKVCESCTVHISTCHARTAADTLKGLDYSIVKSIGALYSLLLLLSAVYIQHFGRIKQVKFTFKGKNNAYNETELRGPELFWIGGQVCSYSTAYQRLITEGSLPCSKQPSTTPYPERHQFPSISPRSISVLSTIYVLVFLVVSFL
jgi:hypothetical protein